MNDMVDPHLLGSLALVIPADLTLWITRCLMYLCMCPTSFVYSLSFSVYSPQVDVIGVTKVRPTHILAIQEIVVRFDDSVVKMWGCENLVDVLSWIYQGFSRVARNFNKVINRKHVVIK